MINLMFLIYVMLNAGAAWNMLELLWLTQAVTSINSLFKFSISVWIHSSHSFLPCELRPTQNELPENPIQIHVQYLSRQMQFIYIIYLHD